jgi:hypothetical protein
VRKGGQAIAPRHFSDLLFHATGSQFMSQANHQSGKRNEWRELALVGALLVLLFVTLL